MNTATAEKRQAELSSSARRGIGLPQSQEELALRIKRARADRLVNGPKNIGQNAGKYTKEIAGCGK
ncbi:hypothetical protein [Rhodovibrio sodomensis]|uniref:hypothetical protein n=1 Tax=Rhodovibrio sodomensis TaxID=1088 RepID=UPI0019030BBC|nr:hypothetical protein [Rhodovibrio sodomensis]